jgi:hypothetical protein
MGDHGLHGLHGRRVGTPATNSPGAIIVKVHMLAASEKGKEDCGTATMNCVIAAILLAGAMIAGPAAPALAADFDLTKGTLTQNSFGWPEQLLTLKNNTNTTVTVMVECGFLNGEAAP